MTTTTHNPGHRLGNAFPRCRDRGFTLVEVMVSAALCTILMAAVLTAFLLMGRSQANAYHYVAMEQSARHGLEQFARDVRMATWAEWTDSTRITLTVPRASGTTTDQIDYYYDSTPSSPTYQQFMRSGFDPVTGVSATRSLIQEVESFEFERWMLGSSGRAANALGTHQLQVRLSIGRQSVTAAAATNLLVSARFLLRNKADLPPTSP